MTKEQIEDDERRHKNLLDAVRPSRPIMADALIPKRPVADLDNLRPLSQFIAFYDNFIQSRRDLGDERKQAWERHCAITDPVLLSDRAIPAAPFGDDACALALTFIQKNPPGRVKVIEAIKNKIIKINVPIVSGPNQEYKKVFWSSKPVIVNKS